MHLCEVCICMKVDVLMGHAGKQCMQKEVHL